MLLRGALVLFGLWSMSPNLPAKTLLDGTAQLCPEEDSKGDTAGVRGVHIYAFDAAKAQKIRDALESLNTVAWDGDGVQAMRTFNAEYARLISAMKEIPHLGAATTNGAGDFRIMVPAVDSVLLFAEQALDDQPFFFASKLVDTRGKDEVKVTIPMCNK
jgi:hypothetical protein